MSATMSITSLKGLKVSYHLSLLEVAELDLTFSAIKCLVVQTIALWWIYSIWLKSWFNFFLFSVFLILTVIGLINLLSEETTFLVSTRIPSNVTLPFFTICPHASNETFLDKKLLAKNLLSKRILPFPINVSAWMQSRMDGQYTTFDLLSDEVLKNNFNASFNEIWDFHCKIYPPSTKLDSCTPCLTFKNPTFEGEFEIGQVSWIKVNK